MKSLIIGEGQIGSALYENISGVFECYIRDIEDLPLNGVEVLHICFPDSDEFVSFVKSYQSQYKPALTIVHSSILVGKTKELGENVVYSPMRGRHPKLATEMKLFAKFVGGYDPISVDKAADYLSRCGFEVRKSGRPETLELLKLLSNIHMGLEVAWAQEVKRICQEFSADYRLYFEWEDTYRKGYVLSGDTHLMRPIMSPKPIGGHCILECTDILSKSFKSMAFEFIKASNEKAKSENAQS